MSLTASPLTDDDLLGLFRAGDEHAFAVLWRRHQGTATVIARAFGCSGSAVDDVVAEAFTRILQALRRGSGPTDNFCGYLAISVRRLCHGVARHEARHLLTDRWDTLDSATSDQGDLALTAIRDALLSLPKPWRDVLWKIDIEGQSVAAIAAAEGRTPGSVSALAFRARRRLRSVLATSAA